MTFNARTLFAAILVVTIGACGSGSNNEDSNCSLELRTALRHEGPFDGACADERVFVASLLCDDVPVSAIGAPDGTITVSNKQAVQKFVLLAWDWETPPGFSIFIPPPAVSDEGFATDEYPSLTPDGVVEFGATYSLVLFENQNSAACTPNAGYKVKATVDVPGRGSVSAELTLGDGESGETPLLELVKRVTLSDMQGSDGTPRYSCEGTCPDT